MKSVEIFPINSLYSSLKITVLNAVSIKDALKLLKVSRELRQYFLENGPFRSSVSTIHFNVNLNKNKALDICILDSQTGIKYMFYMDFVAAPHSDWIRMTNNTALKVSHARIFHNIRQCRGIQVTVEDHGSSTPAPKCLPYDFWAFWPQARAVQELSVPISFTIPPSLRPSVDEEPHRPQGNIAQTSESQVYFDEKDLPWSRITEITNTRVLYACSSYSTFRKAFKILVTRGPPNRHPDSVFSLQAKYVPAIRSVPVVACLMCCCLMQLIASCCTLPCLMCGCRRLYYRAPFWDEDVEEDDDSEWAVAASAEGGRKEFERLSKLMHYDGQVNEFDDYFRGTPGETRCSVKKDHEGIEWFYTLHREEYTIGGQFTLTVTKRT